MNTPEYWNERYREGLGAGNGSKGNLYEFKLRTVQEIVNEFGILSVVDVGCGDGTQMQSLQVELYHGLDISPVAIEAATSFADKKRTYQVMSPDAVAKDKFWDMAMSIDVLFHLPDDQYAAHMDLLFRLAKKYVLIYAPNRDAEGITLAKHMHFREFSKDVPKPWKLERHVKNEFPPTKTGGSYSEFYLYSKTTKRKAKQDE